MTVLCKIKRMEESDKQITKFYNSYNCCNVLNIFKLIKKISQCSLFNHKIHNLDTITLILCSCRGCYETSKPLPLTVFTPTIYQAY